MAKQLKCVALYLPPDDYAKLERAAQEEEREPVQQARWLIKRWLAQLNSDRAQEPQTAA